MITVLSGSPGIKRKYFAQQLGDDYHYCYTDYSVPRQDLGIVDTEYKRPYEFIRDNMILGGTFSRAFLEQLRSDFKVRVINIVRHPTVSYLLNAVNVPHDTDSPMGVPYLTPLNTSSALDNIALSQLDYVTTIRFEDMLHDGYYMMGGQRYDLPNVHNRYNSLLTRYEYFYFKNRCNPGNIQKFNHAFSNFNTSFVNDHNDNRLPNNIFEQLNYTPLSYEEIFN